MPLYRVPEDCRSHFKEYAMMYLRAKSIEEALELIAVHPDFIVLSGSTDIAVGLKDRKGISGFIDISALRELRMVNRVSDVLYIGALSTVTDILQNSEVQKALPLLVAVAEVFASHQVRNIATLAGNIANASPAADFVAPLLVLNATVTLGSKEGERVLPLKDFFCGYKCIKLDHEMILSIAIPLQKHQWYYRKTGVRKRLNIAKVSVAMIKNSEGYAISGASLNPYALRFGYVENLLNSGDFDDEKIREALDLDLSPSGSFRSTKAYRMRVAFNMIKEALLGFSTS